MIHTHNTFIFLLFVTLAVSQTVDLSQIFKPQTLSTLGPEYNDPNFIKLIDNYFGCKTWVNGSCIECSQRYVFNNGGICCQVDALCQQFNAAVGICESCYTGYSVSSNGSCVSTNLGPSNVGCASWKNKVCESCSVRYVFNSDRVCTPVSDHCREWESNGKCTSCYYGYEVVDGACVLSEHPSVSDAKSNPYCAKWKNSVCESCATRAYFNEKGICTAVNDYCNTWEKLTGDCLTCFNGYDLNNGSCVFSPSNNANPSDPGCKTWNNGVCKQCSKNWVFNAKDVCIPVSDQCKTADNAGNCASCYKGYDLVDGSCVFSPSNNNQPKDGGCASWDWDNELCLACSKNWVFDVNGLCIKVNDQCRTYDPNTGSCTGCYRGYDLQTSQGYGPQTGQCIYSPSNNSPVSDAGCKIWDWNTNTCTQCSQFWYFVNGVCVEVSNNCQTYDKKSGQCLSCYSGYDLVNGLCVFSPSNNANPSDPGCKTWISGVCKQCSKGWAFNSNNICTVVSDLCKTSEGLACTSCYNGYSLVNGSCIFNPLNSALAPDAGCSTWNWNNQTCIACAPYWFFKDGICTPVSSYCKTYDSSAGACLTCYLGYTLDSGSCVISKQNDKPSDIGCANWDWTNQKCLKCSPYWVPVDGSCKGVSPYCKTYDDSGACTSCFSGYGLNNGACSSVSTLCKSQDATGNCLTCYNGYALYKNQCVSLSSIGNIALYYAACCPQKLAQLQAEGRIPQ